MAEKKQYGLVLKKKETTTILRPKTSVFGDDDETDETEIVDVSYSKTSASTMRTQNHAKRQHESALAADPTIFDYDEAYEEIEAIKNQKIADRKVKDSERSAKYADAIIKAHLRREIEKESREERQQQREREKEGDEFADKETFVTGAYKERLALIQELRVEEAEEQRFNELTSVEKQKVWQAGLQRQILEDIARTEVPTKKKERNTRKRLESGSEEEKEAAERPKEKEKKDKKVEEKPSKSIYSDDEEPAAPKKNFEGDLKPGLNRVSKKTTEKAETKAERIRNRMFTPSPPPEEDRRRETRRRSPDDRKREEELRKEEAERKKDVKPIVKKRICPEEMKAQRLVKLKEILKQRNGPEEIAEYRARYLERLALGVVQPPL